MIYILALGLLSLLLMVFLFVFSYFVCDEESLEADNKDKVQMIFEFESLNLRYFKYHYRWVCYAIRSLVVFQTAYWLVFLSIFGVIQDN